MEPEIKAMRAIKRALHPLPDAARRRVLLWAMARDYETCQDAIAERLRPTTVPVWSLPKSRPWTGI
jgi:hypothetical protein